jgi:hypothetical protein
MEKFFTILLFSFVIAAVLERLDFTVLGVLVMWIGFIWSVNEMPEAYSSTDREQHNIFIVVIGTIVFLIGAGGLYDALNGGNAPRNEPGNYQNSPEYFNGYDCSGHEAGYDWARENAIKSPSDCETGNSSFDEGCTSGVEVNQGVDSWYRE